ncbi:unnamed protein product [Nesidiocoris tenuis]|uniref:Uncharacterized protein n=1 Tax=Nesidiocoris tenuis TaxID=355587 RepID=A0A6H5H589_9HEMI|nr:unnamed protein product [Nesidiocoris tenuis]
MTESRFSMVGSVSQEGIQIFTSGSMPLVAKTGMHQYQPGRFLFPHVDRVNKGVFAGRENDVWRMGQGGQFVASLVVLGQFRVAPVRSVRVLERQTNLAVAGACDDMRVAAQRQVLALGIEFTDDENAIFLRGQAVPIDVLSTWNMLLVWPELNCVTLLPMLQSQTRTVRSSEPLTSLVPDDK